MSEGGAAVMDGAGAGRGAGPVSSSVGDYLKAIWSLVGEGVAATGEVARELGVTAPSVTAMLSKLSGAGLVTYEPYRGASLTSAGLREALRLVRRHRLLEMFMVTELGVGWEEVHAEAELMEHVVSDSFTERLAAHLGHPEFDPHGLPIPRADGTVPTGPAVPLADGPVPGRFRVGRVAATDAAVLAYLEANGVVPGAELLLRSLEPGGNLVHVELAAAVGGAARRFALSRELAAAVLGEPMND